jgi:8-oxo-dGTP pyrophosphatase MutT (NUDIX family)
MRTTLIQTSAGGIIFRRRAERPEICLIRDAYGYWAFPKGKVEPGETLEQTALREVREEVGIEQARITKEIGISKYRFLLGAEVCRKTVHWFLMEAPPDAECVPVAAEHVQDCGWFGGREALSLVGYRNLRPLLRKALRTTGG